MWVSVGLAMACALVVGIAFYPPSDLPRKAEWILLAEALFAGPMIIASMLSLFIRRLEARRVFAGFQIGYIVMALVTYGSTFTGEHDAQYQLALLGIPILGYLGILVAGIVAVSLR